MHLVSLCCWIRVFLGAEWIWWVCLVIKTTLILRQLPSWRSLFHNLIWLFEIHQSWGFGVLGLSGLWPWCGQITFTKILWCIYLQDQHREAARPPKRRESIQWGRVRERWMRGELSILTLAEKLCDADCFFTFSVGSEDGRCECKSLAEAGGDPEKELWARRHLI